METIRVLVVDDHRLMRRGLVALLEAHDGMVIAGEAGDAAEAIKSAQLQQPDVILLDRHMPGISGIQALGALRSAAPEAKILMLTVSEDERDLSDALQGGADGYLLKTIDSDALASSIRRALRGESVISEAMTAKLVHALRRRDDPEESAPQLSPREREIVARIARGASNKEIARELGVAESTVKIHVQHVLRKLKLSSRVQIAVYASEHGMAA